MAAQRLALVHAPGSMSAARRCGLLPSLYAGLAGTASVGLPRPDGAAGPSCQTAGVSFAQFPAETDEAGSL